MEMRSRKKRIERLRKRIQKYKAELLKLEMEELSDAKVMITILGGYKYDGVFKTELEESCMELKEPAPFWHGPMVDNSINLSGFYGASYPVTYGIGISDLVTV